MWERSEYPSRILFTFHLLGRQEAGVTCLCCCRHCRFEWHALPHTRYTPAEHNNISIVPFFLSLWTVKNYYFAFSHLLAGKYDSITLEPFSYIELGFMTAIGCSFCGTVSGLRLLLSLSAGNCLWNITSSWEMFPSDFLRSIDETSKCNRLANAPLLQTWQTNGKRFEDDEGGYIPGTTKLMPGVEQS